MTYSNHYESGESKWFETASPSRCAEGRKAPFVAIRVRHKPSVCSALEISVCSPTEQPNGENPWGCSWSVPGGTAGSAKPPYSYSPSCLDSWCRSCHGESGRHHRTRSYFSWCFQAIGHCIGSSAIGRGLVLCCRIHPAAKAASILLDIYDQAPTTVRACTSATSWRAPGAR